MRRVVLFVAVGAVALAVALRHGAALPWGEAARGTPHPAASPERGQGPAARPRQPVRSLAASELALPLEGQVLDPSEHPVAGARVTLDGHRTTTSELDGSFEFDAVPAGTHGVVVDKGLWYGDELSVEVADTSEPVIVHLALGPTLALRVIDPSGAPIIGAKVDVGLRSGVTGADGTLRVRGVELGGVYVRITAAGRARSREQIETGDDPAATIERTIVLGAARRSPAS